MQDAIAQETKTRLATEKVAKESLANDLVGGDQFELSDLVPSSLLQKKGKAKKSNDHSMPDEGEEDDHTEPWMQDAIAQETKTRLATQKVTTPSLGCRMLSRKRQRQGW